MFSKFNNKDVVKKKLRLEGSTLLILELIKQLRLALKLNVKLTKSQEQLIIKELESIFSDNPPINDLKQPKLK